WTVQNNPMSVTIIAPDCTSADALATGIFVLGPEKGIELIENLPGIEGMIISKGMKMVKSGGWREFEVKD
ncbi:FAD:protein FMN transferase, partial [Candidatus Aerophobetes bacterium]|nr:FAD:protein FMN transferase [Candidatus Aerophobetes bacterium]